jgi:hypothetical protein
MDSEASLIWGMLFGAIGLGYFIYGKRQRMGVSLACGIALMVFPYFVPGVIWLVLVGITLMLLPWFVRW